MSELRKPAWKKNEVKQNEKTTIRPLEVDVRNNDVEQAIKVLRNKISKDGILSELRRRRFAEKPSEKKRRKHREALKKMRSKSRGRKSRQKIQSKNVDKK